MILYNNSYTKLNQVKGKPIKLEREIQIIFENNLREVMSLKLVKSEFLIKKNIFTHYLMIKTPIHLTL